jgi:hypothetical protein
VRVPVTGTEEQRLRRVAADVRAQKPSATGPAPIAVLGWLFRPLAAIGAYRWYMNHQHRLHTLVSHVRGPVEPASFGGWQISSMIPVAVGGEGNMAVYFEVFSYAGTVTITAIADADQFPDLDLLADEVRTELDVVARG